MTIHRTSFFLSGFYTLSLVCIVLILKFGVLPAINPPNKTLRGMFVLASVIAGVAGGGIAIFFWKAAKFFIGAWGGFALGLWIQCFRDGGLISPIGPRWIMYIGKTFGIPIISYLPVYNRMCRRWVRIVHNPQNTLSHSPNIYRFGRRFCLHVGG